MRLRRLSVFCACALLAACTAALEPGLACRSDADCDPGDSCVSQVCRSQGGQSLSASGVISATPASQSVTLGDAVAATVQLENLAKETHYVAVSCDGGVVANPASLTLLAGATASVSISLPAAPQTVSCRADSTTSKTTWAAFTVVVAPAGPPPPAVGPTGGKVDHLYFAIVGDTRPAIMNSVATYPTAVIESIYREAAALSPQFMVSTGDYMYATGTTAQAQMDLYVQARSAYSGTLFAAMGNHECDGYTAHNCTLGQTANLTAFMGGLVTPLGQTQPWYSARIDGTDGSWTSKLVVIACNVWSPEQKAWLAATLAQPTTYTLLVRHEPADARTEAPCVADVEALMAQYPYDLSLVGHTHTYEIKGKEIVVGTGGAPLATANASFGFATVEKVSGGWQVKDYDAASGLPKSTVLVP